MSIKLMFLFVTGVVLIPNILSSNITNINTYIEKKDYSNTIRLTLQDIVALAVKKDENFQIAKFKERNSQETTKKLMDKFDLIVGADGKYSKDRSYSQKSNELNIYATKKLNLGTDVEVTNSYTTTDYTNSSQDISDSEVSLKVTQPILKDFGVSNQLVSVNKSKLDEMNAKEFISSEQVRIVYDFVVLYWDSVKEKKKYDVANKSLKLSQDLLNKKLEETTLGAFPKSYIYEIESDLIQKKIDFLNAKKLKKLSMINLLEKLHLKYDDNVKYDLQYRFHNDKSIDISKLEEIALNNRYDYIKLVNELQKSKLELKYRKNQLLPKLSLYSEVTKKTHDNVTKNYLDRGFKKDGYEVGMNFSLPISNDKAVADHNIAKLDIYLKQLELRQKKREIIKEIHIILEEVSFQKELLDAYKLLFDKQKKTLDVEQMKLDNGLSTIRDFIAAQDQYINSELQYMISQIEYEKITAKIYFTTGMVLQELD